MCALVSFFFDWLELTFRNHQIVPLVVSTKAKAENVVYSKSNQLVFARLGVHFTFTRFNYFTEDENFVKFLHIAIKVFLKQARVLTEECCSNLMIDFAQSFIC